MPSVHKAPTVYYHEPRWPALVALLAVGGLHVSLPSSLTVGPSWMLLVVVILLAVPAVVTHRTKRYDLNRFFGYLLSAVVTVALMFSLGALVHALLLHKEAPLDLLRSAAALWITNIIVFASWYWRLDAGGPNERSQREFHSKGAFQFPQMSQQHGPQAREAASWRPGFVDYLFLAFNTSTALSPADTAALSRWAKVLMMVQSMISLTTIVLLAARAVNIL